MKHQLFDMKNESSHRESCRTEIKVRNFHSDPQKIKHRDPHIIDKQFDLKKKCLVVLFSERGMENSNYLVKNGNVSFSDFIQ